MPTCDLKRIQQFLSSELSPREEVALEQHLSTCESCCDQLENATAEEHWWSDLTTYLPDDEDDLLPSDVVSATQAPEGEPLEDGIPLTGTIQNVLQLLAPTDDPAMLGRLGSYEISGVVGAGGMSVVLKGFDRSLNRYVAIKVLSPQLSTSGAARQRFAREAQAAAAILHENVIAIHGVEEGQGLPYLVMPYIRGDSLQKRIDREGPFGVEEILRIAQQTAAGLAAAHAKGLVHRDVKPANILLANGVERVTITDFGLARAADDASLTRSGMIAGTPQYMSPEQARGESMDARSDLFSLGSVMYAMCTGRSPFRSETGYGSLRRITDTQPRRIQDINHNIPDWLCRIVSRLHAKKAADRYASADELATDLQQCLAHLRHPTQQSLPCWLEADSGKHQRLIMGSAALTAVMLAGFLLLPDLLFQNSEQPRLQQNGVALQLNGSKETTEHNEADSSAAVSRLPQRPPDGSNAQNHMKRNDGTEQWLLEMEQELRFPLLRRVQQPLDSGANRNRMKWNDGTEQVLLEMEQELRFLEQQINDPLIPLAPMTTP